MASTFRRTAPAWRWRLSHALRTPAATHARSNTELLALWARAVRARLWGEAVAFGLGALGRVGVTDGGRLPEVLPGAPPGGPPPAGGGGGGGWPPGAIGIVSATLVKSLATEMLSSHTDTGTVEYPR